MLKKTPQESHKEEKAKWPERFTEGEKGTVASNQEASLPAGTVSCLLTTLLLLGFVVDEELVEGRATGNHRQDRDLLVGNDLKKGGTLARALNEPLEAVLEVTDLGATTSRDTHGVTKLDEVGVTLVGVCEAIVVEERLPLCNHALLLVVQDEDLATNVELGSSGELSQGHGEGAVTVNVDDELLRAGDLGTDGGRETVTHRAETTRGDHGARVTPAEVLGGPHLMLTNTSGDDGLVLDVVGHVRKHADDGLRLDERVGTGLLLVSPREALLPVSNLAEPLLAVALGGVVDLRKEVTEVVSHVTFNSLGALNDLVDVLGHDVEVDDTTAAFRSGKTGLGSEARNVTSDTIVETGTEGENEIGLLHGHVGEGGTVHAEHVKSLGVKLVISTETLEGSGDRNLGLLGELLQELGTVNVAEDTSTAVDDGLLGHVDEISSASDGRVELLSAQVLCGERGSTGVGGESAAHGDGAVEHGTSDILGQVDQDGTGAARGSNLEGLVDSTRQFGDVLNHDVPLCAGSRDANDIGLLESI